MQPAVYLHAVLAGRDDSDTPPLEAVVDLDAVDALFADADLVTVTVQD